MAQLEWTALTAVSTEERPAGWRASGLPSDFGLSFVTPQVQGKVGTARNALGTTFRSLQHSVCNVRIYSADRHLGRHKEPDPST
jgi:hypothetical protein